MISWRYHVVSIVAVVLAFGLGILAGTAVVNDEFVRQLQRNTDRAQRERDEALAEVARLERFARSLQPTLRDGQLLGTEVVAVTAEDADGAALLALEELTAAGADVLASIRVTERLAAPAPEDAEVLGPILGTSSTDPAELARLASEALALRLVAGPAGPEDDVLAELLAEGFVTADRDLDQAALQTIGGPSLSIVVAAGPEAAGDASPPPSTLLLPLTERLVELEAPVAVVGESGGSGLVTTVRERGDVPDCSLVTVDDVDLTIGGIALVMGLERLLDDPDPAFRPGGDYGIDPTASAIVPGGEPPASCRVP